MLLALSIRDFVIVDALELEFERGFSALTGETGAGKSILIDALALVLGARSDPGFIREGAGRAEISAEFALNDQARTWLAEQEMETDEPCLLLRRVIDATGRSRGFINGVPVTAAQLKSLGELLVDIHGQHAHQSLMRLEGQRNLLDRHAGLHAETARLAKLYQQWQALAAQVAAFENDAVALEQEKEMLAWQLEELEKLAPQADEWEQVSNSHSRLSHAARLIEGAQQALGELSESEMPLLSRLNGLQQKLVRLSEVDADLLPVIELLDSSRIQMQEAAYAINDYLARIELDPDSLRQVEARLEVLHAAARKYRVQPEQLPETLVTLRQRFDSLNQARDIEVLRDELKIAEAAYMAAAAELSKKRATAGRALSKAVTEAMQELSMTGGSFEVQLNPVSPGAHGLEQVEFLVAGHAGSPLRPLARVASGGELARIALAISVITSSATETPTLIFDEVDSGIGGGVAEVVGQLLRQLGSAHQVLCVTHLPQVASQAESHFQVSKTSTGQAVHPVSRIVKLGSEERVEEIARMLGGVEITSITRKHAREMLEN